MREPVDTIHTHMAAMRTRYFLTSTVWLLLVAVAVLVPVAHEADAQPPRPTTREGLAKRLRYQEDLLRSAEASFEVIRTPTRAEMVPLIKEVFRLRGAPKEASRYVIDDVYAKRNSYKAQWWRSGVKERVEVFRADGGGAIGKPEITAFNGQFVRTVVAGPEKSIGAVHTVEGAHWNAGNRTHPFSLIHYYQDIHYSEIIESGNGFVASEVNVMGRPGLAVTVYLPKADNIRFSLLFDSEFKLIERRLITKIHPDNDFRVYEIHQFEDYAQIDNPTGDPVRMPMRVTQRYIVGEHPPGSFVEYWVDTVTINRLALNIGIPDDKFELAIPAKAEIWDGLGGHGWLPSGERPNYLFPEDAKVRRLWLTWVGVALALLVLLCGALYTRTKHRRTAKKVGP